MNPSALHLNLFEQPDSRYFLIFYFLEGGWTSPFSLVSLPEAHGERVWIHNEFLQAFVIHGSITTYQVGANEAYRRK